jgi:hypothetical protein
MMDYWSINDFIMKKADNSSVNFAACRLSIAGHITTHFVETKINNG